MTEQNPFIAKAKRKSRAEATMMNHLRELQALSARIEEGSPTKARIEAKVEEAKRGLRSIKGIATT